MERHEWLRNALANKGYTAADAARAWGVHDAVLVRFIKTGEPKITAYRVNALAKLLGMQRPQLLAMLGERPLRRLELRDAPLSLIAGIAGLLGMDVDDLLERLEEGPLKRRKDNPLDKPEGKKEEIVAW
jgi:hypothetical protein